jgi:hypothetical protein
MLTSEHGMGPGLRTRSLPVPQREHVVLRMQSAADNRTPATRPPLPSGESKTEQTRTLMRSISEVEIAQCGRDVPGSPPSPSSSRDCDESTQSSQGLVGSKNAPLRYLRYLSAASKLAGVSSVLIDQSLRGRRVPHGRAAV